MHESTESSTAACASACAAVAGQEAIHTMKANEA
jgi:hypothetical protein